MTKIKTQIEKIEKTFLCHSKTRQYSQSLIGHGVGLYIGLDKIGSPSPIMIFIIISYLFICTFLLVLFRFIR